MKIATITYGVTTTLLGIFFDNKKDSEIIENAQQAIECDKHTLHHKYERSRNEIVFIMKNKYGDLSRYTLNIQDVTLDRVYNPFRFQL